MRRLVWFVLGLLAGAICREAILRRPLAAEPLYYPADDEGHVRYW